MCEKRVMETESDTSCGSGRTLTTGRINRYQKGKQGKDAEIEIRNAFFARKNTIPNLVLIRY